VLTLSLVAKLAWPIQITVFVLLFIGLPRGTLRLLIIFGYIIISGVLVRLIRRKYA
jgi:hypothetical protein